MPDDPPTQPEPQPNQRDIEMAALGYQPAQIRADDGSTAVSYFKKVWSQPVRLNEFPDGSCLTRPADFRPWSPHRSRQRLA